MHYKNKIIFFFLIRKKHSYYGKTPSINTQREIFRTLPKAKFVSPERRVNQSRALPTLQQLNRPPLNCLCCAYYLIYNQRPKAEGLSKIRVAKNFGYRVEVCLFRRRMQVGSRCLSRYARIKKRPFYITNCIHEMIFA